MHVNKVLSCLWLEAVNGAVYLINHGPTKANAGITPKNDNRAKLEEVEIN